MPVNLLQTGDPSPYLKRWKWEVGQFFDRVGPDASEDEVIRISPNHPVFRIVVAD